MALISKKIDWRTSQGHQRLLINFLFPNSADNMPKWIEWNELLGESVASAIQRLKESGALTVVNDPMARVLHNRGVKDLKSLCSQNGVKPSGTKLQMAERLLEIDATGMMLGYSGELLKCSPEGEDIANARKAAWEVTQLDDQDLRGIFDQSDFEAAKERLTAQFRQKGYSNPSDDDVKWSLLNSAALKYAKEGQLGLCGNTYLTQARFLQRRNKTQGALRLYLLVCAYDLNGAQNRGVLSPELLQKYPLFDVKMAFLAPLVVDSVRKLMAQLNYSLDQVRAMYFEATSEMGFPLKAERSWSVLCNALEGKIDLNEQPEAMRIVRELLSN